MKLDEISAQNLARLYEAQLAQHQIYFDINTGKGVEKAKSSLVDFFFDLQVKLIKPDFFFEIGAFSATTSIKLKKAVEKTKCFAFEASVYNYDFFRRENDYKEAGVEYINAAISNTTGTKDFLIQESIAGSGVSKIRANNSLLKRSQKAVNYEKSSIDSYRLDDFLMQERLFLNSRQASFWIDAEGAAFDVLQGMEDTLAKTATLFIEVEERQYWKGQILADEIILHLLQKGFIPVARDFEAPFQYNVIFVHDSFLKKAMYKRCRSLFYKKINRFLSASD